MLYCLIVQVAICTCNHLTLCVLNTVGISRVISCTSSSATAEDQSNKCTLYFGYVCSKWPCCTEGLKEIFVLLINDLNGPGLIANLIIMNKHMYLYKLFTRAMFTTTMLVVIDMKAIIVEERRIILLICMHAINLCRHSV